jgi:hypothetical protein
MKEFAVRCMVVVVVMLGKLTLKILNCDVYLAKSKAEL